MSKADLHLHVTVETKQRVKTAGCFVLKPGSVLHWFHAQSRYKHLAVFHACIADTLCLPERHSCDAQAERLQQYQDRIAQESEAVLLRAETQRAQSNLELLVNSLGEEQAEQSMEARYAAGTPLNNIARGGGLCGQLVQYAVHVRFFPICWGSFTEFPHLPEINPRVLTFSMLIACAPRYQRL